MNLHEYQAKSILDFFGLPVSRGVVVDSVDQVSEALDKVSGKSWVAKAQVHAGGRGKAGGVQLVSSKSEALDFVKGILGKRLVTFQTDQFGQPVNKVLIETASTILRELYLGAVIDRQTRQVTVMASTEGGVNIEEVASSHPEKIHKISVDPVCGLQPFQGRYLSKSLGLDKKQSKQLFKILQGVAHLFSQRDLSLLEVNPLAVNDQGDLFCLDAKINVDESALYRQSEIGLMRDESQEDARENQARAWDLNYVSLDGDIGCMVNGAGLAMATMDLVQLNGGSPANFLDVGGSATSERVGEAFKIILQDDKVRAILVNIFGGIVRCDLIAEGILDAVKQIDLNVPVVVRLEGNRAQVALRMLSESNTNIVTQSNFDLATKKVIELAKS